MTSSKRQKASRTNPPPAPAPAAVTATAAPAVIPIPTGRRLMLAKRQSEPPPAPPSAPEAIPESGPVARTTTAPTGHDRQELVARMAYFRAERLGFGCTDPVEDWLWAEREVERMLAAQSAA